MENPKQEPTRLRLDFRALRIVFRFARQYRHPEALDAVLEQAGKRGATDKDVITVRRAIAASREVVNDPMSAYRSDQYLAAGMGAVDLILLPTLLPMGMPDHALMVAYYALAVSLVCVAWALFINFVKRDLGIVAYGRTHSTLVLLSLLSGGTALTATFWHVSWQLGVVFLVFAMVAFFACAFYLFIVRTAVVFIRDQQAAPAKTDQEQSKLSGEDNRDSTE